MGNQNCLKFSSLNESVKRILRDVLFAESEMKLLKALTYLKSRGLLVNKERKRHYSNVAVATNQIKDQYNNTFLL